MEACTWDADRALVRFLRRPICWYLKGHVMPGYVRRGGYIWGFCKTCGKRLAVPGAFKVQWPPKRGSGFPSFSIKIRKFEAA